MTTTAITTFSAFLFLIAMILYIIGITFNKKASSTGATIITVVSFVMLIFTFVIRAFEFYGVNAGTFTFALPVTNLYESLQFFSLVLVGIYLVYEYKTKTKLLGIATTAVAGASVLFATAIGASDKIQPLVPALQSNWLLAHVTLSFIGYVCFALSAICAFTYLVATSDSKSNKYYTFWTSAVAIGCASLFMLVISVIFKSAFSDVLINRIGMKIMCITLLIVFILLFRHYGLSLRDVFLKHINDITKFDAYTYKFAVMGFIIFTLGGLIFGAIWAEQAWGRYWSWDPKETWAFITWLVYGIYLHRGIYSPNKQATNALALVGFAVTIFTFLGVNLLLSGLHSYGGL